MATHIISQDDLVFDSETKKFTLEFHKPLKTQQVIFKQFFYRVSAQNHPNAVVVNSNLKDYLQSSHIVHSNSTSSHSNAILLLEEKDTSGKYSLKNTVVFETEQERPIPRLEFWYTSPDGTILSNPSTNQQTQTTLTEQVLAIPTLISFLDFAPSRTLDATYSPISETGANTQLVHIVSRPGVSGNSSLVYSLQYGTHAHLVDFGQSSRAVVGSTSWQSFLDSTPYDFNSSLVLGDSNVFILAFKLNNTNYVELFEASTAIRVFYMQGSLQWKSYSDTNVVCNTVQIFPNTYYCLVIKRFPDGNGEFSFDVTVHNLTTNESQSNTTQPGGGPTPSQINQHQFRLGRANTNFTQHSSHFIVFNDDNTDTDSRITSCVNYIKEAFSGETPASSETTGSNVYSEHAIFEMMI